MGSIGQSAEDGRKNQPPGIKKPDKVRNAVKSHILSLPAVESHYCRKNTTRKYLSKDLNIKKCICYIRCTRESPQNK